MKYNKICEICSEEYITNRPKSKYCSFDCVKKSKFTIKEIECKWCKKLFKPPTITEKHCCWECAQNTKKNKKIYICINCNKEVSIKESVAKKSKYCSQACYSEYRKKQNLIECPICHKKIKRWKKRIYCSIECYQKEHQNAIIKVCPTCGKEIKLTLGKSDRKFCSFACYLKNTNKTETSIEKQLYTFLETIGLEFEKQFKIGMKDVPDAYISKHNLCIYADGAYWHSFEGCKNRDRRVTERLINQGYKVFRMTSIKDQLPLYELETFLNTIE